MKTLIACFSYSGNTWNLVRQIQEKTKFDVIRIEKKTPYSSDYHTCAYVQAKEEMQKRIHPEILPLPEVKEYERILLFFPIWWYTYPMCVETFLMENLRDYKGEVILSATSYTNDPMYMSNALRDARLCNPSLNVKAGLLNKKVEEHIEIIRKGENCL